MVENTAESVRAAALGNREAFETLVHDYAAMVSGIAYSTCGDFALSEDITQEAFIEAWKNLRSIQDPEKFPAWICTIARRGAVDALRGKKSSRAYRSIDDLEIEVDDPKQLNPEAILSIEQERQWVWSLLARLPEIYREPMVLFYRCDESTRDVAVALGESEATIRQRLKRGRDLIRAEMADCIRRTLVETAPKGAFAALVMASVPASTYAAGATVSTVTAAKSSGLVGTVGSSAVAGSLIGSFVGLAGGLFGSWMSWKNCEYVSQQRFVVRQIVLYLILMGIFCLLLAMLIAARNQGQIGGDGYSGFYLFLMLGFQALNFLWIWRTIVGYKKVADRARLQGEPIRLPVQGPRALDAKLQANGSSDDGSIDRA
jgi:RNA polymerase sigma factor (sigma-70 family)